MDVNGFEMVFLSFLSFYVTKHYMYVSFINSNCLTFKANFKPNSKTFFMKVKLHTLATLAVRRHDGGLQEVAYPTLNGEGLGALQASVCMISRT